MYNFEIEIEKKKVVPTLYYYPLYKQNAELRFYGRIVIKTLRSYQFTLKLKVPKEHYDPETKLFTRKVYNDYIKKINQLIKNIYLEKYADDIQNKELVNKIYLDVINVLSNRKARTEKEKPKSLLSINDLLEAFITSISENKTKGTIICYNTSILRITNYCKKYGIATINQVPKTILNDFIKFLEDCNYKHNTINHSYLFLKSFLKYCYHNQHINTNLCENHKSKYITPKVPDKIKHLSKEEIGRLEKLENLPSKAETAKDLFLFQYYTGLSYTDTQNFDIEKDTVKKDGIIFFSRLRNKNSFRVNKVYQKNILNTQALAILKKYGNKAPQIDLSNYNSLLKKVAKKANLNQPISSHVARKTKGYLLLNEGVPIEVVQTILGHSDLKTTQSYYARVDFDLIQKFVS